MKGSKTHLYPRIKCPFCAFYTTQAQSLGEHLVDIHTDEVVKGYKKIRTKQSDKNRKKE